MRLLVPLVVKGTVVDSADLVFFGLFVFGFGLFWFGFVRLVHPARLLPSRLATRVAGLVCK